MQSQHIEGSKRNTGMLIAICLGAFLSHFTVGVMNVSLPQLTESFGVSLVQMQWLTTGYLLIIAAFLPIMGKLGDRIGRRRIHNTGYLLFALSTLLMALAPSHSVLLGLRLMQAGGSAMYQATNLGLIATHIPSTQRGRAMGLVSSAVALGALAGPLAGGAITQWLSWQWLFLLQAPLMGFALVLALSYIPADGARRTAVGSFDWLGAVLFSGSISSLVLALSMGNTWGWLSPAVLGLVVGGGLLLACFWLRGRGQQHKSNGIQPFVDLSLFARSAVWSGLVVSGISFALANVMLVVVPLYLAGSNERSPLAIGLVMAAYPLVLAFAGPTAGALSDRYGSRRFQWIGLTAMTLGAAIMLLPSGSYAIESIVLALVLSGLGMGLLASPTIRLIMNKTASAHAGAVGGMIALMRNMGMVTGAAIGLGLAANTPATSDGLLGGYALPFIISVLLGVGGIAVHACAKDKA